MSTAKYYWTSLPRQMGQNIPQQLHKTSNKCTTTNNNI